MRNINYVLRLITWIEKWLNESLWTIAMCNFYFLLSFRFFLFGFVQKKKNNERMPTPNGKASKSFLREHLWNFYFIKKKEIFWSFCFYQHRKNVQNPNREKEKNNENTIDMKLTTKKQHTVKFRMYGFSL